MRLFKVGDKVFNLHNKKESIITESYIGEGYLKLDFMTIRTDGTGHNTGLLRCRHIGKQKKSVSWVIK